ncbi:MAG: hypothetical protein RMJ66_04105 [Bacteroidia bacterium]|nr:hypothetical protein [Bacteroidia bacterium]MDW8134230.1 hypothetical protein [Bacteroidia bacterium]
MGWATFRLARQLHQGVEYLQIFRWDESEPLRLGKWIQENLPDTVLLAATPSHVGEAALFFARRSTYVWVYPFFLIHRVDLYRENQASLWGGTLKRRTRMEKVDGKRRNTPPPNSPDSLRAWGITHLILPANACLPYRCLWKGNKLSLWEIPTL